MKTFQGTDYTLGRRVPKSLRLMSLRAYQPISQHFAAYLAKAPPARLAQWCKSQPADPILPLHSCLVFLTRANTPRASFSAQRSTLRMVVFSCC